MPDSSEIDQALMALLGSDVTLLGYCPNGVYWDEAPQGSTRFVIVSQVAAFDEGQFGGRAYEDIFYAVEARMREDVGGNIKAAAARIDQLLEDQRLTVAGYTWMTMHREERIRFREVDDISPDVRWQRRGGRYRVQMAVGS